MLQTQQFVGCIVYFEFMMIYYILYEMNENVVIFRWDEDEVRFVLDQHAELDFYSASSLKTTVCG
jgi:hypothetical protein